MSALWDDRGHARRIKAAARAAGCSVSIVHGLRIGVENGDRPVLTATFSGNGALHRSSVRTATQPTYLFAEVALTPAESTAAIVGWFEAGMPREFDVIGFLWARWLS